MAFRHVSRNGRGRRMPGANRFRSFTAHDILVYNDIVPHIGMFWTHWLYTRVAVEQNFTCTWPKFDSARYGSLRCDIKCLEAEFVVVTLRQMGIRRIGGFKRIWEVRYVFTLSPVLPSLVYIIFPSSAILICSSRVVVKSVEMLKSGWTRCRYRKLLTPKIFQRLTLQLDSRALSQGTLVCLVQRPTSTCSCGLSKICRMHGIRQNFSSQVSQAYQHSSGTRFASLRCKVVCP